MQVGIDWWKNHLNLRTLFLYLKEKRHPDFDDGYWLSKPWKYEDEFKAALEWERAHA